MKACQFHECPNKRHSAKYCYSHYKQERDGKPLKPIRYAGTGTSTEERFWSKVSKGPACWEWAGAITGRGYGSFYFDGKNSTAHRYSYQLANGKFDPQLMIDHLCHNTACVNPSHLRTVTNKQNQEHRYRPNKDNRSSGALGVVWHKRDRVWQAQVKHEGLTYYCGSYPTRQQADDAVRVKRNELFTHNDMDRAA